MITPAYCTMMARYNGWQNRQLMTALDPVPEHELTADRGAFFGSILGTLSHTLWADQMWMSRFVADFDEPSAGIKDSATLYPGLADWKSVRNEVDERISAWASSLTQPDIDGDLAWYSSAADMGMQKPLAFCISHMFNHQTHHRGQVHAMMTSASLVGNTSDLIFLPEFS
jgi:uncharacterized damage-inducible protein DinB